ncbi:unnamed protein product [Lactuca virosa]|uniref:DNA mismatch repair protein PMS1 n=1 Tax=Lactuca virosa TaxID=75947 RepID=A0AAU9LT49_9ASTR|nr:unnamed protein product [Lactuca virosa]
MEGDGAASSAMASPSIKPINKSAIHKICAGQVILDLPSAVKELVENSLDAGSTSIEIALKEYGEESFQVIDNGCGISPDNFKVLALKHHTSKLADFSDLQSVTTFGFRGEALSALCYLGDLTVETRTKSEQVATHLTFGRSGLLTDEKKTARQVGTTVTVKKLFSNLPVRSKEFHRNIRKEYGKLISLLNAYALTAKGVRMVCTNMTGANKTSVVLKTQGSGSLKDNIITVFGMSTFNCLEPMSLVISDSCKVDGFLSKSGNGSGRNIGDRQYFFINGRPVDMPKVTKLLNELYRSANSKQYPIAIMNFIVPTKVYDVNVTPDKRKVFFSDEGSLLKSLKEALLKIYSPQLASFLVQGPEELTQGGNNSKLCSPHDKSFSQFSLKQASPDSKQEAYSEKQHVEVDTDMNEFEEPLRSSPAVKPINVEDYSLSKTDFTLKFHGNIIQLNNAERNRFTSFCRNTLSEVPVLRNGPNLHQSVNQNLHLCCTFTKPSDNRTLMMDEQHDELDVSPIKAMKNSGQVEELSDNHTPMMDEQHDELDVSPIKVMKNSGQVEEVIDISSPLRSSQPASGSDDGHGLEVIDICSDEAVASSPSKMCYTMQFSFEELKKRRHQKLSALQASKNTPGKLNKAKGCYAAATLKLSQVVKEEAKAQALSAATNEFEKLFKKQDFGRMKVIGQFNLGFIIGKLDEELFIVDQHAADEKYNYERLSRFTILNQQPLLRPVAVELSPEEEVMVSMHMDTIRKNGFLLEEDLDAPPGQRYKMKAVPFSKNITFGVADVKELISILVDSQGECSMMGTYKMDTCDSVCPPRVRAMLASRACRSSVMIGDPLGRNEMKKIVERLMDLKSPWNCPHGRPTMRHLLDLTTLRKCNSAL